MIFYTLLILYFIECSFNISEMTMLSCLHFIQLHCFLYFIDNLLNLMFLHNLESIFGREIQKRMTDEFAVYH